MNKGEEQDIQQLFAIVHLLQSYGFGKFTI